ncbi:hypothetical protein AA0117_g10086 [Alternaria alternata]|jgi:hypothetical protein|uniref:Uncharacterized protein n=1 Tax=Alternaria alternata TaxID=5599 RepID=A0A4Q4N6G2_ALTAL|nr:hypothetical protein AA0117_g10086 [Alternaria alternata]
MAQLTSRALHYVTTENEVSSHHGNFLVSSANATIPSQLSAQVLYQIPLGIHFGTWNPGIEYTRSVKLPRVTVTTRCLTAYNSRYTIVDTPVALPLDSGTSIGIVSSLKTLIQHLLDHGVSRNTPVNAIPPIWVASPEPGSSSVVGSFIQSNCDGLEQYIISDLLSNKFNESMLLSSSCFLTKTYTVAAFWEPSQHELATDSGSWVVRTGPLSRLGHDLPDDTRPIYADFNNITGLSDPELSVMLFKTLQGDSTRLATALATVFAEVPWRDQIQSASDNGPYTVIKIALTRVGYGYETSSVSARLSLTVIMAYCIFAVKYIMYMLSSGHTSTAWSSATEIIVLAMQSKRSEHLRHVSAGVNCLATYQEPVGIRVNHRDHLELVFEHDQNNQLRSLRRARLDKAY